MTPTDTEEGGARVEANRTAVILFFGTLIIALSLLVNGDWFPAALLTFGLLAGFISGCLTKDSPHAR